MKSAPSMTSPDRQTIRSRDPILLFAQPVADDPTTLGLDSGAALLAGGDALLPSGLPMTIGMDHQPDFVRAVAHACREQVLRGRDWYSHGVMALVGSKNAGRGHAARRLAAATGLPLFVVDASTPAGRAQLTGAAGPGCTALPPFPVLAVAASRCGNPIILIEGVRQGTDLVDLIGSFIDPDRAPRYESAHLGCVLDLGEINWIIQVDGDDGVSRLPSGWASVVRFRPPADRRLELMSLIGAMSDELEAADALQRQTLVAVVEAALAGRGGGASISELVDQFGLTLCTKGPFA